MSYEAVIVCDSCSSIIVGARNAAEARAENIRMGGRSKSPWDHCPRCVRRDELDELIVHSRRGR